MDIKKTHVAKEIMGITKTKISSSEMGPKDSVKISNQAKILAEVNLYKNVILNQTPDVRADKIADARAKLESGYYSSTQVLDSLAGNLASFLSKDEI